MSGMEGGTSWDPSLLIVELMNCQNNARQLEDHLESHINQPCPTFPGCKSLVQSILDSMDKSISMAKSSGMAERRQGRLTDTPVVGTEDSPRSASGSRVSRSSGPAFRNRERREFTKRRKALPEWTHQVRVSPGMGPEGPVEDEYSWRKYGQKEIHGATYPRAYYRCTHQKTLGCPAKKYVQRSEKDPNVFDVKYRGEHTCQYKRVDAMVLATPMEEEHHHGVDGLLHSPSATAGVDVGAAEEPITFPSMPTEAPSASDAHIFSIDGNGGNFSSFISPATSQSNYFQVSTFQGNIHEGPSTTVGDVDLTEMILATTCTCSSQVVDTDFNQSFPFF